MATYNSAWHSRVANAGGGGESNLLLAVTAPLEQTSAGVATWTLTPSGGQGTIVYSVSSLTRPDGSSATISDGTTSTPEITTDVDGLYEFEATATDDDSNTATRTCTVILDSGAVVGTWVTKKDLDFVNDVTTISSLTFGGGETTLFEADGVTEKATVRADVRVGSPTKSANITAAVGFQLLSRGSSDGSNIAVKFDGGGDAWEDPGAVLSEEKPVSVDVALSGLKYDVANNDNCTVVVSDNYQIIGGGTQETRGAYLTRVGASSYKVNGRRLVGGSNQLGTATDETATPATTCVLRIIFWKGGYAEVYWERGTTTLLDGIPTVAGNVKKMVLGTENIPIEGTPPLPDAFWVALEIFTSGGSSTDRTLVLERIRIQELT